MSDSPKTAATIDADAEVFGAVRKILNIVSKLPQPLRERALISAGSSCGVHLSAKSPA
jgi:hypothetical protein